MKLKLHLSVIAIAALFISCSNTKKSTELANQTTYIKSNIVFENTQIRTGTSLTDEERSFIIVTGKSLLEGTAIVKTTNIKGEEIHCESFPAKNLIHTDYKTANSALQEHHLRETIQNYFEINKTI